MSSEAWRPVRGWEGLYEASSLGRVRSLDRHVVPKGCKNGYIKRGKILSPSLMKGQYKMVTLCVRGEIKYKSVHSIVCEAWHGPMPAGLQTAHEDGDKENNTPGNLSWKTPRENMADRLRHGTMPRGERSGMSKLSESNVREIRLLRESSTAHELSKVFGVSYVTIYEVWEGKTWSWLK